MFKVRNRVSLFAKLQISCQNLFSPWEVLEVLENYLDTSTLLAEYFV